MTHPRDHILGLSVQAQTTMTDVTKISCKVRVNGGAATTYTSSSSPAIAQGQDCTFAYHLEFAAASFADGDRVSRTWIYNGTAIAFGEDIIGPASVDGSHYTAARGDKLDELDAPVSGVPAAVWTVTSRSLTKNPRAED